MSKPEFGDFDEEYNPNDDLYTAEDTVHFTPLELSSAALDTSDLPDTVEFIIEFHKQGRFRPGASDDFPVGRFAIGYVQGRADIIASKNKKYSKDHGGADAPDNYKVLRYQKAVSNALDQDSPNWAEIRSILLEESLNFSGEEKYNSNLADALYFMEQRLRAKTSKPY